MIGEETEGGRALLTVLASGRPREKGSRHVERMKKERRDRLAPLRDPSGIASPRRAPRRPKVSQRVDEGDRE